MEFEDLLDSKNKSFIMNNNVVFPLKQKREPVLVLFFIKDNKHLFQTCN